MQKKNFIPQKRPNQVVLQKQIEKLDEKIQQHKKTLDAVSKSHDYHITMLSNFARHDIKNSVQSLDSILSTNSKEELTEDHLDSLKLNIKIIRETIENFTKLVPYGEKDHFEIGQLIVAVELLNREIFYEKKIEFLKEIPDMTFTFNLPFQSVLQMVNNIILNAVKAFEECNIKNKTIKFEVEIENEIFYLNIYDNANKIKQNNLDKIFEYGFSTTGGSGIGLFHAKYLCNLYKGDIKLVTLDEKNSFTKYFSINLPTFK